jgi:glutamine synthetase
MERGIGFDGSSVGFKSVSAGDMVMVPDLETAFIDPFWEAPTLSFICSTLEADTRELFPYDPRVIARNAERFLATSGVADSSIWGPEYEFYVFSSASYTNDVHTSSYHLDSEEAGWSSSTDRRGYSIPLHGGYHAIPPRDTLFNLRARISSLLEQVGIAVKYHHHEVGGPGQCEIEVSMLPMLEAADATLLAKYFTRMAALERGMSATFMPKPLYGEAGSGLHFHQRLHKDGTNLFYADEGYGNLSRQALGYICGLLEHGGAVLAFTNPSTNSYRRLVPGYEAPISAIFSLGNRSASIRIPKYANTPDAARIEFRPPDATSNPYLAIAAQLMAGIDGIRRNLDPSELGFGPIDDNIFDWTPEERSRIRALPTSLDQALDALEADHGFLLEGGVFSEDLIERWIARKRDEQRQVQNRPHPYELELYYDL